MIHLAKLASAVLLALALLTSFGLAPVSAQGPGETMPTLAPNQASVQLASDQVVYLRWGEHRAFDQVVKICTGAATRARFYTNEAMFIVPQGTCQSFPGVNGVVDVSPR
jgi:hypothetical protein